MRAPGARRAALALLAICVCLPAAAAAAAAGGAGDADDRGRDAAAVGRRRVRSAPAADRWLRLLAEYARQDAEDAAGAEEDGDDWFPRPVPVTLPLGRRGQVPVLLLPFPVPHAAPRAAPARASSSHREQQSPTQCNTDGGGGAPAAPATLPARLLERPYERPLRDPDDPPAPAQPDTLPSQDGDEPTVPHLDYVVSSRQLVELFQAQSAPQPELPPAVIPDYTGAAAAAAAAAASPPPPSPPRPQRERRGALPPPPPRLARSLVLRGELTVPRAGYSEPYTVWWDADSGAARVDLHGGATSTYRTPMPDGQVRHLEMRVDRSGPGEVRRCAAGAARPAAAEDRALPALPDLSTLSFAGYVESEHGRVERWTREVRGGAGELGGAPGEALLFRHELLLTRAAADAPATPLKYSVSVDSSVLGVACDGYVHRYSELRERRHEPGFFVLDQVESCDEVQQSAAPRDRLEPLRQFTLAHRDPAHDGHFDQFKARHARRYWDDTEEAVRKNLLMQHSRFVGSGNRQGATFAMEMNHLGDRLDAELAVLRGVREEPGAGASAEAFPHARDRVEESRARLPRQFDWRQHGAVTHVRNQGSCSSCWAFAVTGAVEGALFVRTRTLVPLSEQSLVDCAGPFGGHGCGSTWPSAAYEYVRARGQPALAAYPPYRERAAACAADSAPPVTHISAHVNVTKNDVDALKVAIRRHAPTVVLIDTTPKSFIFYKKGVIRDERCAKNKAEHAVLAVGWGVRRGGEEHIIVKNSWSSAWGEAGFARLQARANTCGVLSRPSFPRLERADVRRLPEPASQDS